MISLVTALPKPPHLEAEARKAVPLYILSRSRYSVELQWLGNGCWDLRRLWDGCWDPWCLEDAGPDARVRQGHTAGHSPLSAKPPVSADGVISVGAQWHERGREGRGSGWFWLAHAMGDTASVSAATLGCGHDGVRQSARHWMMEWKCDTSLLSSTKRKNLIYLTSISV